jgi:hypothetical protein
LPYKTTACAVLGRKGSCPEFNFLLPVFFFVFGSVKPGPNKIESESEVKSPPNDGSGAALSGSDLPIGLFFSISNMCEGVGTFRKNSFVTGRQKDDERMGFSLWGDSRLAKEESAILKRLFSL